MLKKVVLGLGLSHIMVSAGPLCGASIGVDYLYWKAQEDGVLYAVLFQSGSSTGSQGPGAFNTYPQKPKFTWDSGVRLRGGYTWCNAWETEIVWTHFKNRVCSTIRSSPNSVVVATNLFSLGNKDINVGLGATSSFALHYDTIDFLTRCDGYVGECITLTPTVGIRVARIHQRQNIFYSDVTFQSAAQQAFMQPLLHSNLPFRLSQGEDVVADGTSQQVNNFIAAGLYSDLNVTWALGRGVKLFGVAAAGLLGGKFCISTNIATDNAAVVADGNFYANQHRVRFFADLLVGLEWKKLPCSRAYEVTVRAGYEMIWWPNQWQAISNLLQAAGGFSQAKGNLSLQGIVIGIDVGF